MRGNSTADDATIPVRERDAGDKRESGQTASWVAEKDDLKTMVAITGEAAWSEKPFKRDGHGESRRFPRSRPSRENGGRGRHTSSKKPLRQNNTGGLEHRGPGKDKEGEMLPIEEFLCATLEAWQNKGPHGNTKEAGGGGKKRKRVRADVWSGRHGKRRRSSCPAGTETWVRRERQSRNFVFGEWKVKP